MKKYRVLINVPALTGFFLVLLASGMIVALISCGSVSGGGGGGGGCPGPACTTQPQNGVFTRHYNNARTGANTSETTLTPTNVASSGFGVLFTFPVDGNVMAQPLLMPNVSIGGATHNVVFVATENNTVYAFDADGKSLTALWQVSVNPAGGAPVPCTDFDPNGGACIAPAIGVSATPVIDPVAGTIFVEARSKVGSSYFHHLHALDVKTGAERAGSPVQITASVAGTGDGGSTVNFDPFWENSRPALLLQGGIVYLSFGSIADLGTFHGWFLGYDANSLKQVAVFCATPNGMEGSFWESSGPAGDGTNIFHTVANGDFDNSKNLGDSVIRLNSQLTLADSFTPFNQDTLDSTDSDLGSGGPLLLPDEAGGGLHLMVQAGKEGRIYLLNRDHLGGFNSTADQVQQEITGQLGGGTGGCGQLPHCSGTDVNFSTPAYWNGKVYFGAMNDVVKYFTISNGKLSATPASASTIGLGVLGVSPTVSANGNSNGIVWVLDFENGFLRAFDANDLTKQLFQSAVDVVEFTEPTVFNGKVYVGTQFNLTVFGLH